MIKKIIIALFVILLGIQFINSSTNTSANHTYHVSKKYAMSPEVDGIMKKACYDCHSNETKYPSYVKYQPMGIAMAYHVNDGKHHINYSEFTNMPIGYQNHKLEETIEMIEKHEMPLSSYTYFGLHKDAILTDVERKQIIDWAKASMDSIKLHYPADSLVMKRRK
jgi:hypothetical protein